MMQRNSAYPFKAATVLWFFSAATALWLLQQLGWPIIGSVQASETAEPAAAVDSAVFKQEDAIRARVRRRLEAGPVREITSADASTSGTDAEAKTLFEKLQAQQRELEEKTRQLNQREQALVEREAVVKAQLNRYEETLTSLRAEVDSLRGLKNTKLEEFRKIYSKMESKKAARILDDMDMDMAGQILSSLKESQAAEVLGQMDPEKARRITARFLTGRSFSQNTTR